MGADRRAGGAVALCLVCAMPAPGRSATDDGETTLETVTVTATRAPVPLAQLVGNTARIGPDPIALVGHTHPSELMYRAPGTWIARGSGQESLTAIRSPVLTGAGACGDFLFMEDGIPTRPAGFCNVNDLFEINTEQAGAIEVLRGPANALYGSNALHGSINVLSPPLDPGIASAAVELGPWRYRRLKFDAGDRDDVQGYRAWGNLAHDGGYRDDAGYDQAKLNLAWDRAAGVGDLGAGLAATRLRQDTAGFVFGEDAYKSGSARRSNPAAGAFRNADALRVRGGWQRPLEDGFTLELRPYARYSRMRFEQHFLPGTPIERNGQTSGGMQLALRNDADIDRRWIIGVDVDYMDGYLRETQPEPITEGSNFLQETRPAGKHYDYDVESLQLAGFIHHERQLTARLRGEAGLRYEHMYYDYNNRMLDGNTRDDGTACGFGGCLFNRPADRDDDFDDLAPKLGLLYMLGETSELYATARRGFRFPQATELYRLQRQQTVADLDVETIDSAELGWRGRRGPVFWDLAGFYMLKKDVIFRDAEGFNVSDGKTRHAGVEYLLEWQLARTLNLLASGTFARHTYRFDRAAGGGEMIRKGDDVDTAPRRLSDVRLRWEPAAGTTAELEWISLGRYYMDAANDVRYGGHDLFALRLAQRFGRSWSATLRVTNLLDRDYAERADFAFGRYRYLPGRPRAAFFELRYGES